MTRVFGASCFAQPTRRHHLLVGALSAVLFSARLPELTSGQLADRLSVVSEHSGAKYRHQGGLIGLLRSAILREVLVIAIGAGPGRGYQPRAPPWALWPITPTMRTTRHRSLIIKPQPMFVERAWLCWSRWTRCSRLTIGPVPDTLNMWQSTYHEEPPNTSRRSRWCRRPATPDQVITDLPKHHRKP